MLKQLLIHLGLRNAPTPVRTYVAASSLVGAVPALAYVAWKNRDQLQSLWRNVTTPRRAATA
jgi:hypothetical protein